MPQRGWAKWAIGVVMAFAASAPASDDGVRYFEERVRPILQSQCIKCHGGEKTKGELSLNTREELLAGGETGPAVTLDKPAESLLLKAVNYKDEHLQMPPKQKLPAEQIAVLAKWVEMGAPMTPGQAKPAAPDKHGPPKVTPEAMKFWSFQPIRRPEVPPVKNGAWVRTPIDAFIVAKLESRNMRPNGPAGKVALLRRAYYDLTGLPPSPAEIEAFVADTSANAFEKVVDRLLASPHYGEKWGRHWLDLVRFAETNSFERDSLKPNAWRYRDYVIESLNADKPYDQFVREQLAGDELDPVSPETLIATGFYRVGPIDDDPSDRLQARYDELDDLVATTGQVFLGLTINCARCHDHKIDPIPQKDYYRLLAFFEGINRYQSGRNILRDIAPADVVRAQRQELESIARRKEDLFKRIEHYEKPVSSALNEDQKLLLISAKQNFRKRDAILMPKLKEALIPDDLKHYYELRKEFEELENRPTTALPQALAVTEVGQPQPTHVMVRGNPNVKGEQVGIGFPQVLNPPPVSAPPKGGGTSAGRRRILADWIASERNPLTARVIANRLWQYHFGRGIVRSPNDFGNAGERPTHPELLDWLATELVSRGWRLKSMHKLIMMSAAYQMSSSGDAGNLAQDPQNDLFWRFDMRRLGAEEIRDSILWANGTLNLKPGGPGVFPKIPDTILQGQSRPGEGWGKSSPEEQARRSVYVHVKRSLQVPILAAFDAADTDSSCPARFATTQSTQALGMLNSEFVNEQAKVFAARLKREAGTEVAAQVKLALRLTTGREPSVDEIQRGVGFMKRLTENHKASADVALDQFCLLILNLNEFVYLD